MTIMEIILLVIGIIVFIASFRIPIKKEEALTSGQLDMAENEIEKIIKLKTDEIGAKLSDRIDETADNAVEKAERSMERMTNEKIMAINEYADTVLSDIHKNHEEVVFMYDMLNDKQVHLKNTVREAEQTVKSVTKKTQEVKEENDQMPQAEPEAFKPFVLPEDNKKTTNHIIESRKTGEEATKGTEGKKTTRKKSDGSGTKTKKQNVAVPEVLTTDNTDHEGTERNKNEEILRLHNAGKSNMAIAKELDMGVGEVKLVIDLFKGMQK